MWVLTSAYCSVTKRKLSAGEIYHLPSSAPGGITSYCECHETEVLHESPNCIWEYNDVYDYFDTACDNSFVITAGELSDFNYCPYCGKQIEGKDITPVPLTQDDNDV